VLQSIVMVNTMEENIKEAMKAEKGRLRFDFLGKD